MTINNKFEIEQIVYLITDIDQTQRMVTGIKISKDCLIYCLSCGVSESWHYEYEIATDKNFLM